MTFKNVEGQINEILLHVLRNDEKKISLTTANANEDVKQPELSLLQYWWEYKMMRPLGELFKFLI